MDSGSCPRSVPVEVDERMPAFGLEPPQRKPGDPDLRSEHRYQGVAEAAHGTLREPYRGAAAEYPRGTEAPHLADIWPCSSRQQLTGTSKCTWGQYQEEAESLEPPLPLMSNVSYDPFSPSHYQGARIAGLVPVIGSCQRPCCPPAPSHNYQYYYNQPAGPLQKPCPQNPPLSTDVMHEVRVNSCNQAGPEAVAREVRRTISLPEESRNVFITYSTDAAKEILSFIRFLISQGFNPAIDMFDNPIRRMGITKWMDRYLNDRSVLIIVVISPKYREDVEGGGDDEHGLHTKYIYNQIQNEFIQQGCLNFRLVPVLFPNATKKHVPSWLQSTRLYRWPGDIQDLLLRLLREERYIIPPRGADLTLTVRPL